MGKLKSKKRSDILAEKLSYRGGPIKRRLDIVAEKILPIRKKRKFDGETYALHELGMTKTEADSMAQKMRKKGYKARVVKTTVYRWAVYIKRKK